MGSPVSSAKITRPVIAGYLPRKRLFLALDKARKLPLIWIAGPPGSGKTTLASSYIQERRLPALWYQVDEGDADRATFFYYMGLAGKQAAPRRKKPFPLLTPEYLPGLTVFTSSFFEDLFGRLKSSSILVFDNCQSVPDDSPFHDTLRQAISLLPRGSSIIVISRNDPPPAYARLRADHRMDIIGWRGLRLTPEETLGIARLRGRTGPDKDTARHLHNRTGGWAAGLILLMERARLDGVKPQSLRRQTPGEIVDYFGSEVLRNFDEGTREFLLRCAFLPQLTARTAAALTGEEKAGRILSLLHRHNYFTQKLLSDEPMYEFHALFREFLAARAAEIFPSEEIRRLRQAAGALLEAAGQYEQAVGLFREAGDWERLARVIIGQAPRFLAQGRSGMILDWMSHLPNEAVESNPWLLCWKGFCLLLAKPQESRAFFEKAFGMFKSLGIAPGAFLAWSGAVDSIAHGMQDFKQLDSWVPLMDGLLQEYGGFPSPEIEARVTNAMIKALFFRRCTFPGVEKWAQRALAISRSSADHHIKVESLFSVVLYRLARGEHCEVEIAIKSLNSLQLSGETPPLSRITTLWMEASHGILSAQFDRCLNSVSEGLALAEASGVHVLDTMLLGHGAIAEFHRGNLAAGRGFLRRMESIVAVAGPWDVDYFHFLSACEAMVRGDAVTVLTHAKQSLKLGEEVHNPESLVLTCLLSALVAQDSGEPEKTANHLARAGEVAEKSDSRVLSAICMLVKAYVHLESGDEERALRNLTAGMRTAREACLFSLYIRKPGLLECIAAKALEEGIEVAQTREIIKRNRLRPGTAQADLEQWPWPIKVYTLGQFNLLRDEEPVEFARKVQQKPLLLLKTLIAMGGSDVPEERITDALWPEAEGDLAHRSFTAALHRLRQLLGENEALELKEGRLTLSRSLCWVDAWAFERLIEQAGVERAGGGGVGRRAALLKKAVLLFEGAFLAAESDAPVIVSMRDRLRTRLLRAAEELGKHREQGQRWEEAAACYRKALDVDELAEPFYRRLMLCCLKSGREAEAHSVYRRCEHALATALGVKPAAKTTSLLKSFGINPR